MSAEVLRKAAEEIRVDSGNRYARALISKRHYDYELAVADWLDSVAGACTSPDVDVPHAGRTIANVDEAAALTVARVYLGESA